MSWFFWEYKRIEDKEKSNTQCKEKSYWMHFHFCCDEIILEQTNFCQRNSTSAGLPWQQVLLYCVVGNIFPRGLKPVAQIRWLNGFSLSRQSNNFDKHKASSWRNKHHNFYQTSFRSITDHSPNKSSATTE